VQDYSNRFLTGNHITTTITERMLAPIITEAENRHLISIPDMSEVKAALFSIDSSKTLGPDGFGPGFFKQYWDLVKNNFFNCIVEFFEKGKLLRQINHTFLALIPKRDNPSETQHFRQISLCNTVYKTIFKILVSRLRSLLDRLVSPCQSAFIPGCLIHENILLTHEIMHKFKKTKGKQACVALKLDMEKAYDKIKWSFVRQCLQQLGFHPQWIHWIMECISSVSYSLLVNDEPTGMIHPTRGIRQGDPLSPYIFIICMEALS